MITPGDLLDFAFFDLAGIESEVAARRAISASYYAAFHAIAWAGADLFNGTLQVRQRLARSYEHGSVRQMSVGVSALARERGGDPDLAVIATNLKELRQARETADYDLVADVTWKEGVDRIVQAAELLQALARVKSDPAFVELLISPLLRDRRG